MCKDFRQWIPNNNATNNTAVIESDNTCTRYNQDLILSRTRIITFNAKNTAEKTKHEKKCLISNLFVEKLKSN